MKNMKRFSAILMSLVMMTSVLAGCGNSTEKKESSGAESTSTDSSKVSEAESKETDSGEVKKLRIVQPGNLPADYETGIAKINEKLKADVSLEAEVIRIPWDAYAERLNLMLTTGEPFELLHVMQDVKNLSAIAGMDAIISLEDLLPKYPDLVGRFTDLEWAGTLYKGERYAVPASWRSFDNTMSYIEARTDVMKAVGYEEFPDDSVENFIDLSKKMQSYILEETEMKGYNWMHQNQDTAHWLHRTYDSYPFYVENSLGIVLSRQDGTIDSFYESDEFKNDANTYYEMYQAGLINPDVLNLDSQVKYDQAKLGAFLPSQTFDPNYTVTIKTEAGIDTEVNTYKMAADKPEMVYTFVQNLNAISSTAEDPESGLKFLNWLYDSKENHDLFHYGIEGVHYNAVADDRLERTDDMKADDGNPKFQLDTWMTGYMPYIRYDAKSPDAHIDFMTYKADNYVVSPIAGFIFDSSPVSSELTNLQTEIIASIYPIKFGMVSYEENIGTAIEKLKAAGLDRYLEEYRNQFNAYLEANPQVMEMAPGSSAK
ncbi:ABC transporter substrate-binding protein [Scatolibacter rhodanostii]|uniref:ABC transporter substrate-binding protein n=1 Tax=Scatolibacter rhodanostii TaxID=2014781 RepID=UPI000C06E2A3|nr:ABC transporter substrate-binding protein [Scatolibacter rhodanostii]